MRNILQPSNIVFFVLFWGFFFAPVNHNVSLDFHKGVYDIVMRFPRTRHRHIFLPNKLDTYILAIQLNILILLRIAFTHKVP